MKGLLWVLTLAALAVGIAVAVHYNDGYVLLVFSPWRVEVSLNLFLFVLLDTASPVSGRRHCPNQTPTLLYKRLSFYFCLFLLQMYNFIFNFPSD